MSDIIDSLKNMDTSTLFILGFAAVLLIFLLVLIIVTIKVLASSGKYEEEKKPVAPLPDDDDDDDEDEEDDEMSRRVREAVESVEETKAKVEAERIAREMESASQAEDDAARASAAAKVEEIANAVQGQQAAEAKPAKKNRLSSRFADIKANESAPADESDSEEGDIVPENLVGKEVDSEVDGNTAELDTKKIREALQNERASVQEQEDSFNEMAKMRAESPEYNASFDSAFVDRPDNEEKKEPVIPNPTPESVMAGVAPMAAQPMQTPVQPMQQPVQPMQQPVQPMQQPVQPMQTPVQPQVAGPDPNMMAPNPNLMMGGPAQMDAGMQPSPAMGYTTPTAPVQMDAGTVASPVPTAPVPPVAGPAPTVTPVAAPEEDSAFDKKDKKKKKKKEVRPATPIEQAGGSSVARYYWYNQQDVEGLTRKEDLYFKSHYFNNADEIILDLITEMYDCGFVRTEELQRIAYGITFKSLGMKEILRSDDNLGFDKDKATKEPTASDKQEAYEKWCGYVNSFVGIIVINAPDDVKNYILQKMYEYGNRDIEDLMYSPY
ncbi:hypothetical protein SAMN02910369_00460 [Lachnospiraceae bacterium NE2001]|nr:hypothetical protein SAMN02910369_00460 [Lachnospiraceae bacterium NE2001]